MYHLWGNWLCWIYFRGNWLFVAHVYGNYLFWALLIGIHNCNFKWKYVHSIMRCILQCVHWMLRKVKHIWSHDYLIALGTCVSITCTYLKLDNAYLTLVQCALLYSILGSMATHQARYSKELKRHQIILILPVSELSWMLNAPACNINLNLSNSPGGFKFDLLTNFCNGYYLRPQLLSIILVESK